ncbi:MAG: hypothetical protein LBB04_01525 [Oscillospiraceae bacterium]|jgi:hypothetical protein|nr:hypothetical protein [Oscillospiraceae bacterium]
MSAKVYSLLKMNKYKMISIIFFSLFLALGSIWFCAKRNLLLILYNSGCITPEDYAAIEKYSKKFNSVLIDVEKQETAGDIYNYLKSNYSRFPRTIKGVQIFGTQADVPSFNFKFKCKDEKGKINDFQRPTSFVSDLCYSNFAASAESFREPLNIYDIMETKLPFSFVPKWQVSRLPLTSGEISKYIKKYDKFKKQNPSNTLPIRAFVCSTLAEAGNPDDFGYFFKERLDKEFSFLKPGSYKIYGSTLGEFPITSRDDEFTIKNIAKENRSGAKDFFIATHGHESAAYHSIKRPGEKTHTLLKFLNTENANRVLKHNYYTLTAWCCHLAHGLNETNFIHKIMTGKCIDAIAPVHILSGNDLIKDAPLTELGNNNPFYFYYEFFKNLNKGFSRSKSFTKAKASYANAVLKHQDRYNYQFNLHNVLAYHYFGLI